MIIQNANTWAIKFCLSDNDESIGFHFNCSDEEMMLNVIRVADIFQQDIQEFEWENEQFNWEDEQFDYESLK